MHREIQEIRTKMARNPWPKYLHSVAITGLRGWQGQEVRFQFPVCVVCGENGSGKSTVLKAAATAYAKPDDKSATFYPGAFFPDTAWETVTDASLRYNVTEGSTAKNYSINKHTTRWRFTTWSVTGNCSA